MAVEVCSSPYGLFPDHVPVETLDDLSASALVHVGVTSSCYCDRLGVDMLHMVKCSMRGWMWQELTFGSFPEEIDNVVGYLIYCAIIAGGLVCCLRVQPSECGACRSQKE